MTATTRTPRVFVNADPPGLARVRDRHSNTWTHRPNDEGDVRTWYADDPEAVIKADPDIVISPWSGRRSFGLLCDCYGPVTEILPE
jgi:hypothetical protein